VLVGFFLSRIRHFDTHGKTTPCRSTFRNDNTIYSFFIIIIIIIIIFFFFFFSINSIVSNDFFFSTLHYFKTKSTIKVFPRW
jgi:hypothetical protein